MNQFLSNSKMFLKNRSSTILAFISAAGVIATTVMAVKATPKALLLLENAEYEKGDDLTTLEKIKVAAPVYIPSILIGTATIASIFSIDLLGKRNQAALTSAYALIDSSYKEYREKVASLYGKDADNNVKNSIAEDKYDETEDLADDEQWFFDFFSMQYFKSTTEKVLRAEYDFNHLLSLIGYASLNEFYNCLGISNVDGGDQIGWSTGTFGGNSWIDFMHEDIAMKNGSKCTAIIMPTEPYPDYTNY